MNQCARKDLSEASDKSVNIPEYSVALRQFS